MWSHICSSNVDLPIPGSPDMRTAEPSTMPPPSTLSNSDIPVLNRIVSVMFISFTGVDFGSAAGAMLSLARETAGASASCSVSVFHSPQPGHFPNHFGVTVPHDEHTKCVLSALILFYLPGRCNEIGDPAEERKGKCVLSFVFREPFCIGSVS